MSEISRLTTRFSLIVSTKRESCTRVVYSKSASHKCQSPAMTTPAGVVLLPRSVVSSTHGPHGRGPLVGTGASPKFSCGYHGLVLVHAQREHVAAPPRSLNERQTASFGQKKVTGWPFAPGCRWLYSSIVAVVESARTSSMPRECLPVQVES